jgi:hypothetical protein
MATLRRAYHSRLLHHFDRDAACQKKAPSFLRARFCSHNAGPDEERYILTSPIVRVRIRKNFI